MSKTCLRHGAALEDKIVQRAAVTVLNAIYEEDFLGFSYGFRPGRGAHDALDALATGITTRKVNHILDADIRAFFDTVSQEWLIRFIEHRIGDQRMIRLIQKWLKVGVLEDGIVTPGEVGTGPHAKHVFDMTLGDLAAARQYLPPLRVRPVGRSLATARHGGAMLRMDAGGDMIIVRYADDIVVGFEHETDASCWKHAFGVSWRSTPSA